MPVLGDSLALTCQPAHTSCRARADVQHTRVSKCVFWRVVGKKLSEGPFSPSPFQVHVEEARAKDVVVFDSRKEPIILFGCMASSEPSALEAADEHAKYAQNVEIC